MIVKSLGAGMVLFALVAAAGCRPEDVPADAAGAAATSISAAGARLDLSAGPPDPAPEATLSPATLMVEVQGAVLVPGSYAFAPDARVFDALERAGGAASNAEIRDLNIAAVLIDGSVLTIPYRQEFGGPPEPQAAVLNPPNYTRSGWTGSSAPPGASAAPGAGAQRVDLNNASREDLETLPGIGPKTAEKIIAFREQQRFTRVDDLQFVPGIGEKRLETLRPLVTVQ